MDTQDSKYAKGYGPMQILKDGTIAPVITIRDHFALIAMPYVAETIVNEGAIPPEEKPRLIAEFTYKIVDAMMKQREIN